MLLCQRGGEGVGAAQAEARFEVRRQIRQFAIGEMSSMGRPTKTRAAASQAASPSLRITMYLASG